MALNTPNANPEKRKRMLIVLAVVFAVAALAWAVHWYIHGRNHETTDDAYVGGNLIRITPRVSGTVAAVLADDTDHVTPGQVLVRLDDTDARLALDKAEADLAQTVRQVSRAFDTRTQQAANVVVKERNLEQAESDLARRQQAVTVQAVSKEDFEHARAARDRAKAELDLARAQLAASEAEVAGTTVENHPAVKQAEARLRETWLDLQRCEIRAPEAGEIAKRSAQVGQQVQTGTTLMALVPLHQLWVDANFKEDQLRRVAVGQPVEMVSDMYGSNVTFHGTVEGLSPGTGSVFSLLPPQNASGNWIKIVQRLPVRISLEAKEVDQHPLRVGLSMRVDVTVSHPGKLEKLPPTRYEMPVENATGADALIQRIVKANRTHKG